ncbi:MAG: EamA/RhaT family transporter, partial [Pseudomonadota bacterium]
HFTMIKAYALAEAGVIQPFAYFQLVFAAILGVVVFGEGLEIPVVVGAGVVIAAGVFTLWRARHANRE